MSEKSIAPGALAIGFDGESVELGPDDAAIIIHADQSARVVGRPPVDPDGEHHEAGSDSAFGLAMLIVSMFQVEGAFDAAMEVVVEHFKEYEGNA